MKTILPSFILTGILFTFGLHQAQAIPFKGTQILITAPSPRAAEVGLKVAQRGGNFADVAVATALTLSVTSPYFASLGGGGFAMIKNNSEVVALDFRETAPQLTHKTYFENLPKDSSIKGGSAVGVPGIPAGLWAIHQKYGRLKWKDLFSEVIPLAQKGFRVSGEWVDYADFAKSYFTESAFKYFFHPNKTLRKPGELLKQEAMAKALILFRDQNLRGFYSGAVAEDIVESVKQTGGVMALEDLSHYKVRWLQPLRADFRGYTLFLMPPPSSGGVVIQTALELINRLRVDQVAAPQSIDEFHLLGEILSRSFKGRILLGDPDFNANPLEGLLSKNYLDALAKSIDVSKTKELGEDEIALPGTSGPTPAVPAASKKGESTETTHFVVMDGKGNTVSMTITLNGRFGSGVVSDNFGIALNNEMDDFTTRPKVANSYGLIQGAANLVEPGKRPLSSMSPTLVTKDNETVLALGAPGGPTIISGVFQVLYRVLVNGYNMDQAVQAPRVHHQFRPHRLFLDQGRFVPETIKGLQAKGHQIEFIEAVGRVCGVKRSPDSLLLEGAFDSRGEGAATGY